MIGRSKLFTPIGLDLGSRVIKAVQLQKSGSQCALHAAASLPRDNDAKEKPDSLQRIVDMLQRRDFRGTDVVIAVPSKSLLATSLELPLRTPQMPFDQIARQEFARSLQLDSAAIEFAYWDLPAPARAAKATHVMAVGCALAESEPLLDQFAGAGLCVSAVDVQGCALARACAPLLAPPEQITAILDIGWEAARLTILYRQTISYWRSLQGMGVAALRSSLSKQLDVPDEVVDHLLHESASISREFENAGLSMQARRAISVHCDALISELTTSLSYAAHQYPDAPVSRVLLAGGGAFLPGLVDYFHAQIGLDVRIARLKDALNPAPTNDDATDDLLLAMGLAQHGGETA
jgi:type IV pilus assembly protein PilM